LVDQLLTDVPAWLLALLAIGVSCLLSLALTTAVRHLVIVKPREHHNEVLGMLLSIGGIFCAIVVALAVFVVWDHLSTVRQAKTDEGNSLAVIYQDAQTLPQPARTTVDDAVRDYTKSLIDDEFPSVAHGGSSDKTERSLTRLSAAVHTYLNDARAPSEVTALETAQYHLVLAGQESMPPLIWALLIGTCLMLLLMAAPLFMEDVRHHAIGSVLLGCTLGAAIFLILAADHPFVGPLQISPDNLVANLHTYAVMDSMSGHGA
jgi:uncharacterized protein DUF4239